MQTKLSKLTIITLITLTFFVIPTLTFAQGNSQNNNNDNNGNHGYGGGQNKTVCKKTGSPFNPYVKVTVPVKVANKFLSQGGVLPDAQGKCPKGITLRQFINELFDRIFGHH